MSIIQDLPTINGKQNIHSKQKSVCATLKKWTGSNSKITTPKDSRRMQEFCRYGELFKHVMPRTKETIKTYL